MRRYMRMMLLAAATSSGLFASYAPSLAGNFFEDAWGVVTDPLKLGKASPILADSLQRSLIQLQALEAQGNYDVQQRLEQIRSILHNAIGGTQDTIALATKNMLALEGQINVDAVKLIYRALCAARVTMDDFQRSFAQTISRLKAADPAVAILGIRVIDITTKNIVIEDPDQAYFSTKSAALAKLERDVTDNSKAYEILSTYQNLERAAKYARCFYLDQVLEQRFVREEADLERISFPWVATVTPTM